MPRMPRCESDVCWRLLHTHLRFRARELPPHNSITLVARASHKSHDLFCNRASDSLELIQKMMDLTNGISQRLQNAAIDKFPLVLH